MTLKKGGFKRSAQQPEKLGWAHSGRTLMTGRLTNAQKQMAFRLRPHG